MVQLLQQPRDSPLMHDFLFALGKPSTVDHFADLKIVEFARKGITFYFGADDKMVSIFLYGPCRDGRATYTGDLPCSLYFTDTKSEVNKKLGRPTRTGELGILSEDIRTPWERYDFENYLIHVQYSQDHGQIQLITLMRRGCVC